MSVVANSFTAVGTAPALFLKKGQVVNYFVSGTFVGTVVLERLHQLNSPATTIDTATTSDSGSYTAPSDGFYRYRCTAYTSGTIVTTVQDGGTAANNALIAAKLGAVNLVAGLTANASWNDDSKIGHILFTLSGVAITHTDAAGSGSSGSVKLFDLVEGAWQSLGARTNLTLTSDTTMDVSGDMAGVFALGSVAANAGDGALSGTEVDFAATKAFTLSSNTLAVGTNITGAGAAGVDGTATASDIYLNESGSAATSDANGVLTVDGTISLKLAYLGDD